MFDSPRFAQETHETYTVLNTLRSIWIWFATGTLILMWAPLLAVIRLFDRDPVRYRTGLWFRRLGRVITRVNSSWQIEISGEAIADHRRPYVVVSNHQSFADIPVVAHVPWEMKWLGKAELFRTPVVGWMLRMAGDIRVDRKDRRSGAQALLQAHKYLDQKCSVIFFPEGTRSPDGRVYEFSEGAFHMAIKAQVPVLPLAVEGSYKCLPKKTWRFGEPAKVYLKIFSPVETAGLSVSDTRALTNNIRKMIIDQIAAWRGVPSREVDGLDKGKAAA